MYDIKIFIEENWTFWARVNAWKEIIYWNWNNQEELLNSLQEWIKLAFWNNTKNKNTNKIISFLEYNKSDIVCH